MFKPPKPFGIEFVTTQDTGPENLLPIKKSFGKKAAIALRFANRFIEEGYVDRAGVWVVTVKPFWFSYRATLKHYDQV